MERERNTYPCSGREGNDRLAAIRPTSARSRGRMVRVKEAIMIEKQVKSGDIDAKF